MRVYELARELGVESKEVLDRAGELGIEVKTASSGLDEDSAALIRLSYDEERSVTESPVEAPVEDTVEAAPAEVEEPEPDAEPGENEEPRRRFLRVPEGVTVSEFAEMARRPIGLIVKLLIERGQMAGASQPIPPEHLEAVAGQMGYDIEVEAAEDEVATLEPLVRPKAVFEDAAADVEPRPPVVTVMGHVDHGKTQLLDTIRRANVVAGEAGGITQHIGAYQVNRGDRAITFIDTPGHEAFTQLRARGAEITDIVVLVVAANDGVMPQTVEAISHAKAAAVPLVIAVNKIDLAAADPQTVRAQLTEHGLVVEDLGGEVVSVEISALEGTGIDQLLEYIDLIAELEGFSANPSVPASGTVIESQLDKGRGPVGTVIVQRGTLRRGDAIVAGAVAGRVRAMFDENGQQVQEAAPSTPVVVMGWDDVPSAGDRFEVAEDDRAARSMAEARRGEIRNEEFVVPTAADRLTDLLEEIRTADHAELRVIIKADAHGSLEAIRDAIAKIEREKGMVTFIHGAVGGISENDDPHLPRHLRTARRHRGDARRPAGTRGGGNRSRVRRGEGDVPGTAFRHHRRLVCHRGRTGARVQGQARPRRCCCLRRPDRITAPLQGRCPDRVRRLRVRHRARQLPGYQGRRRARGL
jgi:translation initiation factor IF-2